MNTCRLVFIRLNVNKFVLYDAVVAFLREIRIKVYSLEPLNKLLDCTFVLIVITQRKIDPDKRKKI